MALVLAYKVSTYCPLHIPLSCLPATMPAPVPHCLSGLRGTNYSSPGVHCVLAGLPAWQGSSSRIPRRCSQPLSHRFAQSYWEASRGNASS